MPVRAMRIIGLSLFAAFCMVSAIGFAQSDEKEGWKNLLPGQDHTRNFGSQGNWISGEKGVVTLVPRSGESGWRRFDDYLWSKEKFGDFEIQFDYKVQKKGNSGFYFRVGNKKSPVVEGIEVQIYDSHSKGADAKLSDHDSGGIIPDVPPKKNAAKPAGEWNHFHIINRDDKLTVKLNGELVNEVDLSQAPFESRPQKGYIGFQDHGLPFALRNIRIREL